jgi:uncharacterized protein (DUF305 family)
VAAAGADATVEDDGCGTPDQQRSRAVYPQPHPTRTAGVALGSGLLLVAVVGLAGCTATDEDAAVTSSAPVVQLAAPGEEPRELDADEVAALPAPAGPSDTDVAFLQDMVPHHQQALQMTALVEDRSASERVRLFAERMDISQVDEVKQMEDYLLELGEVFGSDGEHHTGELMPGMLTEDEMAALEAAEGEEFDRLFLDGMIGHHQGAVDMTEEVAGEGTDQQVSELSADMNLGQTAEIGRMQDIIDDL